jgi:hypothetical protein
MSYFHPVDLPEYSNLLAELNEIVKWDNFGQICLNAPANDPDNHQAGKGSLIHDWDNSKKVWNDTTGTYDWIVPHRGVPLQEEDFTETTSCFKGTVFEGVLDALRARYSVGRVRIMKLAPKTCLTWHRDDTPRVHYPFKTNPGCKMIIEDEVKHLPQDTWWHTDTVHDHTAINASHILTHK